MYGEDIQKGKKGYMPYQKTNLSVSNTHFAYSSKIQLNSAKIKVKLKHKNKVIIENLSLCWA